MKNKIIILIVFVIIILIGGYLVMNNTNELKQENNLNNNDVNDNQNEEINDKISTNKTLVIYFSATGTTKKVAEHIKDVTNSDIVEIVPKDKYTSEDLSYTNDDCRANKEQNDDTSRPEIENSISVDEYDTIYLGYPIWWGDVPKIILTLFDTYDFDRKIVIPFCTSGGSGISQSENTLKSYNANVNWIDGNRFGSSSTKDEVSSWINELNR